MPFACTQLYACMDVPILFILIVIHLYLNSLSGSCLSSTFRMSVEITPVSQKLVNKHCRSLTRQLVGKRLDHISIAFKCSSVGVVVTSPDAFSICNPLQNKYVSECRNRKI